MNNEPIVVVGISKQGKISIYPNILEIYQNEQETWTYTYT